jgi:hypothetical protein
MFVNITIKKTFSTNVINRYIEEIDEVESEVETFKEGEELTEVDIYEENEANYHVQFGDGSVAFFPKDCVEIS